VGKAEEEKTYVVIVRDEESCLGRIIKLLWILSDEEGARLLPGVSKLVGEIIERR